MAENTDFHEIYPGDRLFWEFQRDGATHVVPLRIALDDPERHGMDEAAVEALKPAAALGRREVGDDG